MRAVPYLPPSVEQAESLVKEALAAMMQQIDETESIVEGEYFFAVVACPKNDEEAAELRRCLEESKSHVAVDESPLP